MKWKGKEEKKRKKKNRANRVIKSECLLFTRIVQKIIINMVELFLLLEYLFDTPEVLYFFLIVILIEFIFYISIEVTSLLFIFFL